MEIAMKKVTIASLIASAVILSSVLYLGALNPSSASSTQVIVFSTFSYSEPNPGSCCPTKFYTVGPINETGFQAGETVTTNYVFPNGNCTASYTADSNGKVYRGNAPACTQGSAVYLSHGAHEGTA